MRPKFRVAVAVFCGYEVAAIVSGGRVPTLTELDKKTFHVLSMVIIGALIVHFYLEDRLYVYS